MARTRAIDLAIPLAKNAAAYPTWGDVPSALGGKLAETYATSATGTGADLDVVLPFDPAYVEVFNQTTLAVYKKYPSLDTSKVLKEVTAGTKSLVSSNGITLGSKKVTLGSGVHAASDVLHIIAHSFRENGGS